MASSIKSRLVVHLLREPLFAFALVGGLLFWLYGSMAGDVLPAIIVEDRVIQRLVADRELVLERQMTREEIDTVRQNFIDQEVLVREAMARGLFLNDGQVRHRLADKMFYLLGDEIDAPGAEELDEFYDRNRSRYRTPETISFTLKYFADDFHRAVNAMSDPVSDDGERFYMGDEFTDYAPQELVAIFGVEFTRALGDLRVDQWSRPLESSRGWHLIRVNSRQPPRPIPRDVLHNRLEVDWLSEQIAESRRQKLDTLRAGYVIVAQGAENGD